MVRESEGKAKEGGAHSAHKCEGCGKPVQDRHRLCRTCRQPRRPSVTEGERRHQYYHRERVRLGLFCMCCPEHHPEHYRDTVDSLQEVS